MFHLFAHSEPETHSGSENDVIDLTNEEGDVTEEEGDVIEEGENTIDLTEEDDVIDLTGSSEQKTGETKEPYFEIQVRKQCTLHSINNAIGSKLIKVGSICESKQGKKDRLESKKNGGYEMYTIREAADSVAANTVNEAIQLEVITLDKLFEIPETMLTFDLLTDWTVDSENPRVKNMIVMWKLPHFHMIALRYFEKKWWLLDSETNAVSLDRAIFDTKMLEKGAELSLQAIYTIVPRKQQIYDHCCSNGKNPIVIE